MFGYRKKKQCAETQGVIVEIKSRGIDYPTMLAVQYNVFGKVYEIKEAIKFRSETIKAGPLPVGQKKVPVLGNVGIGNKVTICYDPNDPKSAHIKENTGKINA